MAVFMAYLPSLLFGLIGGVAADRFDRKRMVIVVDLARALVLVVLVATIVSGDGQHRHRAHRALRPGTAETFADSASSTLIPGLVARDDLGIANARMQGAFVLTNQLLLPPVGAFLFVVGPAIPFAANAVGFVLGAVLISRVVIGAREPRPAGSSVRAEMVDGFRWLVATRRCGPWRSRSWRSTSRSERHGRCWCCTPSERLGHGRRRVRPPHDGDRGRRDHRDRLVRPPRAAVCARRHHARRPAHRDRDAPGARPDDVRGDRAGDDGRVRRARVRVGHDVDGRPPAGRPRRAARPGRRRLPGRHRRRDGDRDADRRPARRDLSGSPRRSGSGSSARRCWSRSCGASSPTSRTRNRSPRVPRPSPGPGR